MGGGSLTLSFSPKVQSFCLGGEGGISPCSSSNSYYDMILQVVGMSLTYTDKTTQLTITPEFKPLTLHPNISMHILLTFLQTFPKRLTRRICLTIKSCFS